jgi:cell fate regulator YaaT (PSP1 superfamily)
MNLPEGQAPFDIYEVRFKNGRKEFYRNTERLSMLPGDAVAVEAKSGHDLGTVSLSGELVRLQLKKKGILGNTTFPKVYRKATQKDLDTWHEARDKEHDVMLKAREIAARLQLEMKVSDVEYQGDGSKATFYYTAEGRIDFRQLIREYAAAFKVRVEMKQIGSRQEASRVGGIGSCGRELCCTSWLSDFRSVSTSAARYQQLALNPQKLAGQCGKLKCCLNYELDSYMEALKEFPDTNKKLQTERGPAVFMKMDIFQGFLWYGYRDENAEWIKLKAEDASQILSLNKSGKKVASLEEFAVKDQPKSKAELVPEMASVEQDAIDRFDNQSSKGKGKRRNKNRRGQRHRNNRKGRPNDKK